MPEEHPQLWFNAKEICLRLNLSLKQLTYYVNNGVFPRPFKRGKKLKVWNREDLKMMEYLEKNKHRFKRSAKQQPPSA